MKRDAYLQHYKEERKKLLEQHEAGTSLNVLARERGIAVTNIVKLIRKARADRHEATKQKTKGIEA